MSLKEVIEIWKDGAELAAAGKYREAVDCFMEMPEPGSRIYFNIASMFFRLGNLEDAERNLDICVEKDPHMAVGFFQRGCLHLQKRRYNEAMDDFQTALKNLRGNLLIDYKQLGLQYKLYSCEVMYNMAYTNHHLGRSSEAIKEMDKAREMAAQTTESRHKIIKTALENMRKGTSFQPYRMPKSSMIYWPPRSKTEVLKPINFMGKAKVLSSIVDQDDYTGFVGAQEQKSPRSPSPNPKSRSRSLSPSPHRQYPEPPSGKAPRVPKPTGPPPAPSMKVPSRKSSLLQRDLSTSPDQKIPPPKPPKPDGALPYPVRQTRSNEEVLSSQPAREKSPARSNVLGPGSHSPRYPRSPSPQPPTQGAMTVKIHYTTTRAIRLTTSATFSDLLHLVCKKFDRPDNTVTLWYKRRTGELVEITNDTLFKQATKNLEDSFRLTVWAYDKQEELSSPEPQSPVTKMVVAISDYTAQYSDELTFREGDRIEVKVEINEDWYEGRCHGNTGIFPKSYVEDA